MNKKYYTDAISDETLAKMIDKTLNFEKISKTNKIKAVLFKIVPAVAMLALVVGLVNILPAMLSTNNFEPGNAGSSGVNFPAVIAEPAEVPLSIINVKEDDHPEYSKTTLRFKDEYGQDYSMIFYKNNLPGLENAHYTDECREAIEKEIAEHGIDIPVPKDGETIYTDITATFEGYTYRLNAVRREGNNIYFEDNTIPKTYIENRLPGEDFDSYGIEYIYDRKKAAENSETFIAHALYTIVAGAATQNIAKNINLQMLSSEELLSSTYRTSPSNIDLYNTEKITIVIREIIVIQYGGGLVLSDDYEQFTLYRKDEETGGMRLALELFDHFSYVIEDNGWVRILDQEAFDEFIKSFDNICDTLHRVPDEYLHNHIAHYKNCKDCGYQVVWEEHEQNCDKCGYYIHGGIL